jgi:uncharacterized metal-binding protein
LVYFKRFVALDGCSMNCAKNSLEKAGINEFIHLQMNDLGLKKGATKINDENTHRIVEKGGSHGD